MVRKPSCILEDMKTFLLALLLIAGLLIFVILNNGVPMTIFEDMSAFIPYTVWWWVFYLIGGVLLSFTAKHKNQLGVGLLIFLLAWYLNNMILGFGSIGLMGEIKTPINILGLAPVGVLLGIVVTQFLRGNLGKLITRQPVQQ